MVDSIKVSLVQMRCEKAAIADNLQKTAHLFVQAVARGVDVVGFPEMSFTGFGLWIAVATQAGRTVDEDFPGGGYVFAPDGRRLFATPDGSPGAVYLEVELEARCVRVLAWRDLNH